MLNPWWRLTAITLAAMVCMIFLAPASGAEEGLDQRMKAANDGVEGTTLPLVDLGGRLDFFSAQLKQNNEALKEQKSRLEDNSIKLYETLVDIDSAHKDLTLMRDALDQMRSAHAKTLERDSAGDADNDRLDLLLPLVLCLLVPLAVVIQQGAVRTKATEASHVGRVLVAWFAGGISFYLIGIGIMYGPTLGGLIGNPGHFLGTLMLSAPTDLPSALLERLIPNLILAGVVSVVACSSAPRALTSRGHFLVAVVAGGLVYPLIGHWIATPTALSAQSGWLTLTVFSCSAATTQVALLGGMLALSLASGLGLRHRATASSRSPISATTSTAAAMLFWIAWLGVILTANTDCLPLSAISLSLAVSTGGAALGVFLLEGVATQTHQWKQRLPFAVLAGIVAAPVGVQQATFVEIAVLGAVTGICASLLMRFFESRSMTDTNLASALLVGGIFGTLAPVIIGPTGFLFIYAINDLAPQFLGMGAALLLGLVAGRALAWPIASTRVLSTPT
jgi:Amt family ammonium transporter